MPRPHRVALVMLLVLAGCAGIDVVPGVASEEDVVVREAYEYLREIRAIDGNYQYRADVYRLRSSRRPSPPPDERPPPPWSKAWSVSFELFNGFDEMIGEVSTTVWRYDEPDGVRYEVGDP